MTTFDSHVTVIGGGPAGCESAWQLAERGIAVTLIEQKPHRRTPAQTTDHFCELVCSNSFRGAAFVNAVGLLKEEMRRAGSLIMMCAEEAKVPAGGALAAVTLGAGRPPRHGRRKGLAQHHDAPYRTSDQDDRKPGDFRCEAQRTPIFRTGLPSFAQRR